MNGVGRLLDEWPAARRALADIERSEHPDITDEHGRTWTWSGRGDLYRHDATLAYPLHWIIEGTNLPSATLVDNPNYRNLCHICTQAWPQQFADVWEPCIACGPDVTIGPPRPPCGACLGVKVVRSPTYRKEIR